MKKNLQILAPLMFLALVSCQKNIQQPTNQNNSEMPGVAAKGASADNGTIYLIVTVDDAAENLILSDNETDYTHGRDRVEAQILSSDGNFYMNTNNNTVKSPIRTMQFLPGSDIDLSGKRNYSLRTAAPADPTINGGNTKWIQNMTVGEYQYMSFRAWGIQQQGAVDWKLLFRNGTENNSS